MEGKKGTPPLRRSFLNIKKAKRFLADQFKSNEAADSSIQI